MRKLTKFVNNQAFDQDDYNDEGGSIYQKGKAFGNQANRKNSDDSD